MTDYCTGSESGQGRWVREVGRRVNPDVTESKASTEPAGPSSDLLFHPCGQQQNQAQFMFSLCKVSRKSLMTQAFNFSLFLSMGTKEWLNPRAKVGLEDGQNLPARLNR